MVDLAPERPGRERPDTTPRFGSMSALRFTILVALGAVIIASVVDVSPSPQRLVDGGPRVASLIDRMMPPDTDPAFLARMGWRLVETFEIALAGTVLGVLLSLPIAWLSARSVSPVPVAAFLFKALVSFFRTVPDLVWALIFVVTVGLGAIAGTMTIMVDTIGFCGRFYAEAMEDADRAPQEALGAIGASALFHPVQRRPAGRHAVADQHHAVRHGKGRSLVRRARPGRRRRDRPGAEIRLRPVPVPEGVEHHSLDLHHRHRHGMADRPAAPQPVLIGFRLSSGFSGLLEETRNFGAGSHRI